MKFQTNFKTSPGIFRLGSRCSLLLLLLANQGCHKNPAPVSSEPKASILQVHPPLRDFGEVLQFEEKKFEFALTNSGDEAVTVEKIERTCGCTEVSLESFQLQPGQSSKMTGRINPEERMGNFGSRIYITAKTDSGRDASLYADVKGLAVSPITMVPSILDFGAMPAGTASKVVRLELKRGTASVSADDFNITASDPRIKWTRTKTVAGASELLVHLDSAANIHDVLKGKLAIQVVRDQQVISPKEYIVPVQARFVIPHLEINPTSFYIGQVPANSRQIFSIKIRTQAGPISIGPAESAAGQPSIQEISNLGDGLYQLQFSVSAPASGGAFTRKAALPILLKGEKFVIEISIVGIV